MTKSGDIEITDNTPQFHNGIVTAKQESSGDFIILVQGKPGGKSVAFLLNTYLALLTMNRGIYQSLGMAYNPQPGAQCLEIVIHYSVPVDSKFLSSIEEIIEKTLNLEIQKENGNGNGNN